MRKLLAVLSVLSVICCFTACSTGASDKNNSEAEEDEVTFNLDANDVSEVKSAAEESEKADENKIEEKEEESSSELSDESAEPDDEENEDVESSSKSSKGAYEYGGISIVMPKGFTIDDSADNLVIAYPETYPMETDSINMNKTNESINIYSEDNINKTMKTLIDDYEGCKNYKQFSIGDCEAVSYDHTINVGGVALEQKQVAVFADETVVITFTNVSGNYVDDFEKTIESIKILD